MKAVRKLALLGGTIAAVLALGTSANATIINKTINLVATFPGGTPSPLNVNFSITFDNATNINQTNSGLVINGSSGAFSPFVYAYNTASDTLTLVGGNGSASPGGCSNSPGSFCSFIGSISTTPNSNFLLLSNDRGLFFANSVVLTNGGAVPEPATWAMMIAGFGLAGSALRRRRAVAA